VLWSTEGEGEENGTVTESLSKVPKAIGHREKVEGNERGVYLIPTTTYNVVYSIYYGSTR